MNVSLPIVTTECGLSTYLEQIKQYSFLSKEEETELAIRVFENQDIEAAHALVTSHLRLVVKIAFKMKQYGTALLDLISEGNIGLMYAVKKFNPYLGYRFSTYAIWWIKASMQDFIIKSWSLVKIGTTVAQKKLFFNLNKLKNKLQKFGEKANSSLSEAEIESIANDLEVSKSDVKNMELRLGKGDASLDAQIINSNDEASEPLINQIASPNENQEVSLANFEELENKKQLFVEAMNLLNSREQDIITSRHLKTKGDTLETMSAKYNVSRERIRQIETRALEKLKEYCLSKKIA